MCYSLSFVSLPARTSVSLLLVLVLLVLLVLMPLVVLLRNPARTKVVATGVRRHVSKRIKETKSNHDKLAADLRQVEADGCGGGGGGGGCGGGGDGDGDGGGGGGDGGGGNVVERHTAVEMHHIFSAVLQCQGALQLRQQVILTRTEV